jgi:hypothetical protein
MAASIGLNMKPVLPHPSSHKAPQIQRKPTERRSSSPKQAFASEPGLVEADYQHILEIIESMAKVMERSPIPSPILERRTYVNISSSR